MLTCYGYVINKSRVLSRVCYFYCFANHPKHSVSKFVRCPVYFENSCNLLENIKLFNVVLIIIIYVIHISRALQQPIDFG